MTATAIQPPITHSNECAQTLFRDLQSQVCLGLFMAVNVVLVWASFRIESIFLPWQTRLDVTTPGWCFALGQAGVVGAAVALSYRRNATLVVHALLVATLVAYAYALAGLWQGEPRSTLQYSRLLLRAVDLGVLSVAGLILGVTVRVLFGERIVAGDQAIDSARRQYGVRGLIFLMFVCGISLGVVNVFFDHADRNAQLAEAANAIVRALPASLPWFWGVMQKRLSVRALILIVVSSLALWYAKAIITYVTTHGPWTEIIEQTGQRAAAYAIAGAINGSLLRGLGFGWRRL